MFLPKTALSSETSSQSQGPQATFTFDQLATNLGVPTTPSCSLIHRNNWTLFCSGKQIQTGRLRFERVPVSRLPCLTPVETGRVTLPAHQCVLILRVWPTRKSPPRFGIQSFYWGFIMHASRNGLLAMWLILSSDPLYEDQTESMWLTGAAF